MKISVSSLLLSIGEEGECGVLPGHFGFLWAVKDMAPSRVSKSCEQFRSRLMPLRSSTGLTRMARALKTRAATPGESFSGRSLVFFFGAARME